MGYVQTYMGIQTYEGVQTYGVKQVAFKHGSKHMAASKLEVASQHTGGIQAYGSISMGAYGHPLSL